MSDETQNVVLDFKMNGQVDFASTVKDINTIMNTASKEFKAQIAAMDDNASSTEHLAAEQQKLQIQYEAASKRTQMLTADLEAMQERGQTSGSAFDRLVGKVADAERVESNLKNALDGVNEQLTAHGLKANEAKDKLGDLQSEETDLDTKMKQARASAKLENTTLASGASDAEKNEAAHRQLSEQLDIAKQREENLKQQLQQTETAYGDNSSQAANMRLKLTQAETTVAELGNNMQSLGQKSGDASDKLGEIANNTFADKLQTVSNGLQSAGQAIQSFNEKAQEAWAETDDAVDNLTSKTGATGEAADQLGESYERVERSTAGAGMESQDLSDTMAGLKTQFGLSGKALEDTTQQISQFSQITGQSGVDAVDALHTSMSQFNLTAKDIPSVLDSFTAASQRTGVPVKDLEDSVSKAYPSFKQLGISLQDGIPMLASWSKSGIDSNTVLKGMQKAFSSTKDSAGGFKKGITDAFNGIKGAKTDQAAFNVAIETFGAKSGPQMAQAIRDGKVSLDDLSKSAQSSGGTVSKTFKQTLDPVDKAKQAQKAYEQEMGKLGGTIQQTLLPVIQKLLPIVQKVSKWFESAPAPVKTVIVVVGVLVAALGALAPVIMAISAASLPVIGVIAAIIAVIAAVVVAIQNWGTIVAWLKGVWSAIATFFVNLWNGIKQTFSHVINAISTWVTAKFNAMVNGIKSIFTVIGNFFKTIWNGIKAVFVGVLTVIAVIVGTEMNIVKTVIMAVWNAIKGFIMPVVNAIKSGVTNAFNGIKSGVTAAINAVKSVVTSVWNVIKSVTSTVWDGIKSAVTSVWTGIKSAVSSAAEAVKSIISGVWNGIKTVTSNVWSGIKDAIMTPINAAKDLIKRAIDAIKGFFDFHISWPHIPMPHFSVEPSGWKVGDLLKGKIPHLGITWNAEGALFTKPTIAGAAGGNLQGFGEAGPEAALPLNDKTWDKMGAAIAAHMPGQGSYIMQVDGQTFARLTVGYNADASGRQIALKGGLNLA